MLRISLEDIGSRRSDAVVARAMATDGFVLVSGLVTRQMRSAAIVSARDLFLCEPEEVLTEYVPLGSPFDVGYMPYGRALAGDSGIPNLLRSWTVGLDSPHGIPPSARKHWVCLAAVGRRLRSASGALLSCVERGVGARSGTFAQAAALSDTMLVLDYPPVLPSDDPRARRQSRHTDPTLLSLLPLSDPPGLVVRAGTSWKEVTYAADEVLVMVGTALERMTAGGLAACHHTVAMPERASADSGRSSLVYFVPAEGSVELSKGAENPAESARALQDQYFRRRFAW